MVDREVRPTRLAAALLVVSACTSAAPTPEVPPAPSPEQPVRGGDFVHAIAGEPDHLQPNLLTVGNASLAVVDLVYANLVTIDPSGRMRPWLGTWAIADAGRTWEWRILPQASWSDGTPLTSRDVVTAVRAAGLSKKSGLGRLLSGGFGPAVVGFADFMKGLSDEIPGIVTYPDDAKRFTVRLTGGTCINPLSIHPLPSHVFGKYVVAGAGDAIDRAPENISPALASGPFVLSEWRRGEHLRFVRNANYALGPPLLDSYTLKILPTERWFEQLQSGAVHYASLTPTQYAASRSLENDPRLRVEKTEGAGFTIFGWNTESRTAPALTDKRVRQALAYAFDTDLVRREIVGLGQPALAHHVPGHWAHPSGLNPYRYDPRRARELIEQAGYTLRPDGIYERDGRALAFTLETNSENEARQRQLQLAVDMYRAVGVRVTPEVRPFSELTDRHRRGLHEGLIAGFELSPYLEGDPILAWHSSSIGVANNVTRYRNAEVDRLIDAARAGPDCSFEARRHVYERMNRILNEEQPGFFGLTNVAIRVVPARLRGYGIKTYTQFDLQDVHRWWLAPEKK